MEKEVKLKIDNNGSSIIFLILDGELDISKNNYVDFATLTVENAIKLRDFLNEVYK